MERKQFKLQSRLSRVRARLDSKQNASSYYVTMSPYAPPSTCRHSGNVQRTEVFRGRECLDVFLQPSSRPRDGGHMPRHRSITIPSLTLHGKWRFENFPEKQA